MNKIKLIFLIITRIFLGGLIAYAAVTIPVPLAPGSGYTLISTSTGYYVATSTAFATSSITNLYASSTFPSFTYASSTYLFVSASTSLPYIPFASSTLYVPYTGANANVNLNSYNLLGFNIQNGANGSASASTYAFTNFPSTGMYVESGPLLDFSVGTQKEMSISQTGGVTILNPLSVTGTSTLATTTITGTTQIDTTNTSYPLTVGTTTTGGQSSAYFAGGIMPRIVGYTASTSETVNTDILDIATTTFSFATTTLNNPSGTAHDGQMFSWQGYATTSRAVAFGTIFATSTSVTSFPSAIASGTVQFLFQYRQAQGNWIILGQ